MQFCLRRIRLNEIWNFVYIYLEELFVNSLKFTEIVISDQPLDISTNIRASEGIWLTYNYKYKTKLNTTIQHQLILK